MFDVSGELSVFLEAFLWIGIDLGFSTITLFEASERFVDEVIARFDWECIHEAPKYISKLTGTTLELKYRDALNSNQDYRDENNRWRVMRSRSRAIPIDENLTLGFLLENGYFDSEYSTRAEELALSSQLANLRNNPANAGKSAIIVSNGIRVEVYHEDDVDTITTSGTDGNDVYEFRKIDGHISHLTLNLGKGNDTVNSTGDSDNNTETGLTTITINGQDGNDYINIDSALLAPGGSTPAGSYHLLGGQGNDRLKITGVNSNYSGVLLEGGLGDDKLTGADGPDRIFGGHDDTSSTNTEFDGFDIIVGNGGNDYLDGGDEWHVNRTGILRNIAVYSPVTGSTFTTALNCVSLRSTSPMVRRSNTMTIEDVRSRMRLLLMAPANSSPDEFQLHGSNIPR